jgi:hypothetical protein
VGLSPLTDGDGNLILDDEMHPIVLPDYYYFLYHEDIESYAASVNLAWGQYTFAAEVAYRDNVPMQADAEAMADIPFFGVEAEYATGETLNVTLNTFSGGMRGNFFCDSQDLIAEIAYEKRLGADNEALIPDSFDKDGFNAKVVYEPFWYQVLPGLDLSLPMGAGYTFGGTPSSLLWGGGADKTGDFNFGVGGTYNAVWEFELTYRNFFGDDNAHADRDYASFYIRRAF